MKILIGLLIIILLYSWLYYYCKSNGYEECVWTKDPILCVQIKRGMR